MKKLLFALAGAASFAALATDIASVDFELYPITGMTSVVGYGDNGQTGSSLWDAGGGADNSIVKEYDAEGNLSAPSLTVPYPGSFVDGGDRYLELNTEGSELQRKIPAADQEIGSGGIYVDTLVQFTPSESAPDAASFTDAKLAIWLGVENNVTNLMVQAGAFDSELTLIPTGAVFALTKANGGTLTVDQGTWYRLTVKALPNLVEDSDEFYLPAFEIRLDGDLLKATGGYSLSDAALEDMGEVFSSDVQDQFEDGTLFIPICAVSESTLTAVGFKGSGALDDFVVTTEEPNFTPAGGNDYKVVIEGSDVVITPQAGDLAALAAAGVDTSSVAAVNEALATPIVGTGTPGIPAWQALFLGVAPTTNGLEQVAIDSITMTNGVVTVEMADGLTLMTGRGVDIVVNVLGSDDLSIWDPDPIVAATNSLAIPAITPEANETKKFYKVQVDFAATPAQQ